MTLLLHTNVLSQDCEVLLHGIQDWYISIEKDSAFVSIPFPGIIQKVPDDFKMYDSLSTKLKDITSELMLKDSVLYWGAKEVSMPKNIKVLEVYGGYRSFNTLLVLCRTTDTVKETQMRPPFFATEFFVFSTNSPIVSNVYYLDFSPPYEHTIYVR